MQLDPAVRDAAREWIDGDVDADDRQELDELLASAQDGSAAAVSELTERMSALLAFGTAGLRGPLRAGPNGMNRAVVVRATAGLATWLLERSNTGTVVVGYDARHGSQRFAREAAAVLCARGFEVRLLPEPLPTPVLAHATRALGAVAGVQITASHNPPQDNGYKVYLEGGTQLVAPADTEIESAISRTGASSAVPRQESWTVHEQALNDYLARVGTLPRGGSRDLRVAATALHGVGAATLRYALHLAGFTEVYLVDSQADPDPEFPTVAFPNPEEPGATDALLELASEVDADLAVALDPDADRCALGIPGEDGDWRMLRGDETGVLLGAHILATPATSTHPDPLVATTIVSATMLRSIAHRHGARYDETLTGFKWLVRAGGGSGSGLVYAYEEALGHCVDPEHVRDKDGISAAVLACDLAATTKAEGRGPQDLLDELDIAHGVHDTAQVSVRVTDLDTIAETMRRLRADPPAELAGATVGTRDLLPDADVLVFASEEQDDGGSLRVVVRPSGTEPKLKCYLQVVDTVSAPAERTDLESARTRARERMSRLDTEVRALVEQ